MKLALYQPDMAPNVGAAIRLAACFGVGLDIIEPCGFPLTSRDIKRVAMDYRTAIQPRRHASWNSFETTRNDASERLILLTTKGAQALWDFRFQPSDIILTGRESEGAPDHVHSAADGRVLIPIAPGARSLNLVTSASIALAEASRQLGLNQMSEHGHSQ